jgi:ACT domain-containing protein
MNEVNDLFLCILQEGVLFLSFQGNKDLQDNLEEILIGDYTNIKISEAINDILEYSEENYNEGQYLTICEMYKHYYTYLTEQILP